MTAPGTLLMAKMLVPETEQPLTAGRVEMPQMEKESNILGAIARGTSDGLHLALNVGAMLITFLALLALLNAMMGGIHNWPHMAWFPQNLQTIFGWIFSPVAWLIGIPWHDAPQIGNLLGTRTVLNEFVAFSQLGPLKGTLDPRSFTIATFALCADSQISAPSEFKLANRRSGANRRNDLGEVRASSRHARGHHGELDVSSIVGLLT
jgi:CNT family concentrative nucleoside transporter